MIPKRNKLTRDQLLLIRNLSYGSRFRTTLGGKAHVEKENKAVADIKEYCVGDKEGLRLARALMYAHRLRGLLHYHNTDPQLDDVKSLEKAFTLRLVKHFEAKNKS